ncbi:hypothetical protein DAI22_02g125800 [Oryza sativa Japonica Group]|nr:hypothetical protein DAI22_02g125800 [Oryza sativa Japonica Group]
MPISDDSNLATRSVTERTQVFILNRKSLLSWFEPCLSIKIPMCVGIHLLSEEHEVHKQMKLR